MNALIFGGMSQRHHDWVRQVNGALAPHMDEVRFLDYRHWESGEEMDIEYEIGQAALLAEGLDKYVVIAKSIGTAVTTLAIARGLLKPEHCVFMGFPLAVVEKSLPEVDSAIQTLPPTVFLHNEHDPLGSAEAVKSYLEAHSPISYELRELPGDTHDYIDFELITQLATKD